MSRIGVWVLLSSLGCSNGDGKDVASGNGDSGGTDDTDDTGEAPLLISTERKVLHEVFTGSNTGPCLGADALMDAIFHDNPGRYTTIKYQLGTDPYITTESVSRRMYYLPGESSYAIPYVHADGIHGFHPAELNDDEGYGESDLDAFVDVGSILLLDVSHTISGQTVDFEVSWTALDPIEGDNLVLHAAIIENMTTLNIGSNGQTEFHQVMKKLVPDEEGTPIESMVREDEGSLSLSYTFNGSYDDDTSNTDMVDHLSAHTVEEFDDLEVVVWVQDTLTWEVYQSAWTID